MPWRASDADRHKKGLSDKQKRQWAHVANSMLSDCLKKGGSQATCEARAVRAANSAVGNPARQQAMQQITVHVAGYQTRHAMLDGRTYLVAPAVPIVESVLNEFLVPASEIGMFVEAWNGIAVPIGHPQNEYGDYVSANSPEMLEQSVGRFFNARMDGQKLVGEVWLDIAKCQRLGGAALECLQRMQAGDAIELSTAFWPHTDLTPGIWNGMAYKGVHRHLRPDHLALLPHAVGACSIESGCGVRAHATQCACLDPTTCHCDGGEELEMHHATGAEKPNSKLRNALRFLFAYANEDEESPHAQEETSVEAQAPQALVGNLTHHDLHTALCAALAAEQPDTERMYDGGLVDIEAGWVIYHRGEEFYRRPYTVGDNQTVALTGEPESVQRVTTYVPTTAAEDAEEESELETEEQQGGVRMLTKQELIGRLVAHERTAWTEEQVPVLQAMEERLLEQMLGEAERRNDQAPLTLDALKTFLKKELDDRDARFDQKLATYTQQAEEKLERTELVAYLQTQGWTEAEAMGLPLTSLQRMRQTLDPVTYAARGAPRLATSVDDHLPSDNPDWG